VLNKKFGLKLELSLY